MACECSYFSLTIHHTPKAPRARPGRFVGFRREQCTYSSWIAFEALVPLPLLLLPLLLLPLPLLLVLWLLRGISADE